MGYSGGSTAGPSHGDFADTGRRTLDEVFVSQFFVFQLNSSLQLCYLRVGRVSGRAGWANLVLAVVVAVVVVVSSSQK